MRAAPVVGSVLVHLAIVVAGALAVAATSDRASRRVGRAATAVARDAMLEVTVIEAAPPPVATDPLEVVLLDAPLPAVATVAPGAASAPPLHRRAARIAVASVASVASGASGAGGDVAEPRELREPAPSGATGRGLLAMRGPSLTAEPGVLERLAEGGRPLPASPRRSGELHDLAGGRAQVDDLVTTATVARDGTVRFDDKPNLDVHFHIPALPTPSGIVQGVRDAGRAIGTWALDPYAQTRYGSYQDLPRHLQASDPTGPNARCASYGDPTCDDAGAPDLEQHGRETQRGAVGFGGTFDVTAALMKKLHVGDPWATRKRKILEQTFAERAAKGDAWRDDQLARSAVEMQANLERLWAATLDPAARRAALFQLWDECDEADGSAGDAGGRARTMVIGWIRARLPAGSAAAFTPAELADLSAHRTSRAPFAPYADP